jgi:hypothetical protein
MFELIISSVKTGRVQRKLFRTREQADRYLDKFLGPRPPHPDGRPRPPRCLCDYRVEVEYRAAPAPTPVIVPAMAPAA